MCTVDEVRLGTIGSGKIVHSILNHVRVVQGIRLVAVYSRCPDKAEDLAKEYGASGVYTNMDAFLADENMNFVYIATPNQLHYAQTKRALLAGKNVICEKPFCTRSEDARELAELAKERGLVLIEAVPTAFLPNLEILKRDLPKIGKVKLVHGNYSQYSSRYDDLLRGEIPNIFNPQFGGGSLMDINFYNVYLNVTLFGKPRSVAYHPNLYQGVYDTSGILVMNYDGFVSEAVGAKDTWGENFFQIEGETGYIYIPGGSNGLEKIRVVTKDSDETFTMQENPDRWYYEIENMTKLILSEDRKGLYELLETTVDVVEVLENARKGAGIFFPGD